MITNNGLRLNVVVSVGQRFLFKDLQVSSLKEIYADNFFTPGKIEELKENSFILPSAVSVDCVELVNDFTPFIEIENNFLSLFSIWEFHFNDQEKTLIIVCADGMVHSLDEEAIIKAFNEDNISFLPVNLQGKIKPLLTANTP